MPKPNNFDDKRKNGPRIRAKVPVRYWEIRDEEAEILFEGDQEAQVSYSMNLGTGGLYLFLKERVKVERLLRLHLFLPSTPEFLSVLARVVWVDNFGAGLCFEKIKAKDHAVLKEYLRQAVLEENA